MENNDTPQSDLEKKESSIFAEEDLSIGIYDKHIRQARNAIFAAAALILLSIIISVAQTHNTIEEVWLTIVLWGLFVAAFVGLGFWTKRKPYYAIVTALILYAAFIILNAVIDIRTLFSGIIIKIIIIALLAKGINDAKSAQELQGINK